VGPPPGELKEDLPELFPRSEIDVTLDLTGVEVSPEALDLLMPPPASSPSP
jgi:hypothetical protein